MIILIVVFLLFTPFIGFTKQKIYTNGPFDRDKDAVIRIITESGFIRHRIQTERWFSKQNALACVFSAFLKTKITLDYTDNPLVMEGMRRDVQRIASHMEHYFRSNREDE
jgi:hypothetical protein